MTVPAHAADVAVLGGGPGGCVPALVAAQRGARVILVGRTEGSKLIELDRTEIFTRLRFQPRLRMSAAGEPRTAIEARTKRALQPAQKYSLVANSVKSEIVMEPDLVIGNSTNSPVKVSRTTTVIF